MIPCYNAKLCGNARRVTRVTEQTFINTASFLRHFKTPQNVFKHRMLLLCSFSSCKHYELKTHENLVK